MTFRHHDLQCHCLDAAVAAQLAARLQKHAAASLQDATPVRILPCVSRTCRPHRFDYLVRGPHVDSVLARSQGDLLHSIHLCHLRCVFLRMSWRSLGSGAIGGGAHRQGSANDVQSSHRGPEALTTLALLAHSRQERDVHVALDRCAARSCAGLVLNHGYDGTPTLCVYGALQEQLEPYGRYLLKVVEPGKPVRWRALPFAAFRECCPRRSTHSGVLEVFGQRLDLHWQEMQDTSTRTDATTDVSRDVRVAPQVLARNSSSCTFNAIEKVHPRLTASGLNTLASECSWIVVNDAPDSSKANRRCGRFRQGLFGPRVLHSPGACVGHKVTTVMQKGTRQKDLVGDVHALQSVYSIAGRRNKFWSRSDQPKADGALVQKRTALCVSVRCCIASPPDRCVEHGPSGLLQRARRIASRISTKWFARRSTGR